MNKPASIDEYIKEFSKETQHMLQQVRAAIKEAAPEAEETISYGIPTFKMGENIVHFGSFKHHIGFYPTPDGIAAFKEELSPYEGAKGSVKFPLNKPMPLALIKKMVCFRIKQVKEKIKAKQEAT